MTPLRLGALAVSLAALIAAVWLVFVGPAASPAATNAPVAAASNPVLAGDAPDASSDRSAPPSSADGSPVANPSAQPSNVLDPLLKQEPPHSVDPAQLTGYIWPVKLALITTRFAPEAPTDGGFVMIDGVAYHDGLDLATHCDDKVEAAHDGTVLYAGRNYDPYLGYQGDAQAIYDRLQRLGRTNEQAIVVVIDDGNGYRSVYVHLAQADVEQGAQVHAGDVIGLEGATGFASGCHLHYTLIRMDGPWQPVVSRLLQFGYPPLVRERVDPLDVLPWGDPAAPQRLQDKVNPPSPTPLVSPSPSTEPSVEPSGPTNSPIATSTPQ
jgi:murein DD-endopeptidase MepM/ murein hydrolase activator NlpD